MALKRGSTLGPWTLDRQLGEGGNAHVWLATSAAGTSAAVKVLKADASSKALKRFRTEVEAHRRLDDIPGVVPLQGEPHIPERPTEDAPAWFAMPVAARLRKALGERPLLSDVLHRVAELAETLRLVAERGSAHRDIKPENLFIYEGRAALGDLGLATYDDKPELTGSNENIGPRGFIAPEMMTGKQVEDCRPADVYCLAKVAWVLATDQNWPPPGQLRLDVEGHRVAALVTAPRASQLDLVLSRATSDDPASRPPIGDFATELRALLQPVAETIRRKDLDDVRSRIAALEQPDILIGQRRQEIRKIAVATFEKFQPNFEAGLAHIRSAINGAAGSDGREYMPGPNLVDLRPGNHLLWTESVGFARSSGNAVLLFVGFRFELYESEELEVEYGARVFRVERGGKGDIVHDQVARFSGPVGSASFEQSLHSALEELAEDTRYLDVYVRMLESPKSSGNR